MGLNTLKYRNFGLKWDFFTASDLNNYLDADRIRSYCREGCVFFGKNWSCPPQSPDFEQLDLDYACYVVIIFSYQFNSKISGDSTSVADAFDQLIELGDRLLNRMEKEFSRNFSIRGHKCEWCDSCPGFGCPYPEKRRYDFPSLGIDITSFMQEKMNYQVVWNKKGQSISTLTSVGAFPLEPYEQTRVDQIITATLNASLS